MVQLFQNKYRVQSCRLKGWDYALAGYYFITICTKNRIDFFGEIKNGRMVLSQIGEITKEEWIKTALIRKNVILDEFIIMPNHIHGIVIINNDDRQNQPEKIGEIIKSIESVEVEAHCNAPLRPEHQTDNVLHFKTEYKNKFGPQRNNLASIVRGYKGVTTKKIKKINGDFAWQNRYYDHIIRNEQSLYKIREYIFNNPLKWGSDRNNN